MVRTVISLEPADKTWLDRKAREEGVSMTELVRRAIRRLRADERTPSLSELLERSRGTWQGADGLEHQQRLRGAW